MPKPRQIGEAAVSAVVFRFLKKLLDYYTTNEIEGKKRIVKKASIKEGMAQGSNPSNLLKDKVQEVVNDPNNLKRVKAKVKKILEDSKVKPTNDTAANMLLDEYKRDTRELRNFTELDQGVEQIFTNTFLDNLRERVNLGIERYGEPKPVEQKQEKEEEQPQQEEADEDKPTPTKKITTKKKIKKIVEETPPSSNVSNISSAESVVSDTEDIITEFRNAIKALKRQINSVEGKEQAQRLANEFLEERKTGGGFSAYNSYIGLNKIINNALRGGYVQPSTELADIGTDLLYGTGFLTKEEREEKIGQEIYGSNERKEERKQQRKDRDEKKKKREVPSLVEDEPMPQPIPTKRVDQKEQISVPLMEQLKQNVSAPSMSNGTGLGLTLEELKEMRSKGKPTRKVPKIKPSQATDRAKLEEAFSSVLKQEKISTKKNVTTGFEEMGQRLDNINVRLASIPELKQIHDDVVKQLERGGYDLKKTDIPLPGLGIDKKIVEELIKTIPERNRAILAPAVRSIAGSGGVNMNNVVAGLVGLGVSMAGSPAAGAVITPIVSGILNTYGVDLGHYFLDQSADGVDGEIIDRTDEEEEEQPQPKKEKEKEEKHSKSMTGILSEQEERKINEDVYDVISGVVEEAQPQATPDSKRNYIIDSLLSLPETVKRRISTRYRQHPQEPPSEVLRNISADLEYVVPPPSQREGVYIAQPVAPPPPYPAIPPPNVQPVPVRRTNPFAGSGDAFVQGAGVGAVYGAGSAGISTGSAIGAVSGILPGAIAGGIAGLTSEQLLRRHFRRQGVAMTPELNRRIRSLSALPAMAVASYLGYTSTGRPDDVVGQGVLSGAGITEKKITVEPEVLAQTKAQLDQDDSKNKHWQPKTITPTPNILDESQQEKYADDVEFVAFNYIPPTSEGAEGTVDTNPLKYQQLLESKIRYTDAGVYIPYITWNKINDANNMTSQQLKSIMMGPELPRMKFNTFDNDTTFENVSKWQYVNGENTSIEYQSPYADFSNVENSWWSNETSELFTINP